MCFFLQEVHVFGKGREKEEGKDPLGNCQIRNIWKS